MPAEHAEELSEKWTRQGRPLPDDVVIQQDNARESDITEVEDSNKYHKAGHVNFKKPQPEYTFTLQGETYLRRGPFRLFDLPFEVREIILSLVIGQPTVPVYRPSSFYAELTYIPMAKEITAYGNHQLRLESLLLTLKNANWELHSLSSSQRMQAWLSSLDFTEVTGSSIVTGFEGVQSLDFKYFTRFPCATHIPGDIAFMRRCPNLSVVSTTWVTGDFVGKSVPQLRQDFRLDGILELRSLRKLNINKPRNSRGHEELIDLAKWLRQGFVEQGQETEVTVDGQRVPVPVSTEDSDD